VALIAVVAIVALQLIGENASSQLDSVGSELEPESPSTEG
jgi:Flp pilus assembly pilin Flp